MEKNPITSAWTELVEHVRENHRERKSRQLDYDQQLVENFNYSPKEFYALLGQNLDKRRVPGLRPELVHMNETVMGSAKRLYLMLARERFVYYVCAAPFGSGFFFSWRLVDERQPGTWIHFFAAASIVAVYGVLLSQLAGATIGWVITGLLVAAFWSAMRFASLPGFEALADSIERTLIFGRIFERLYRPDTYYREDSQKMYKKAFENAMSETIASVTTPQGTRQGRPSESPLVSDLHRR